MSKQAAEQKAESSQAHQYKANARVKFQLQYLREVVLDEFVDWILKARIGM